MRVSVRKVVQWFVVFALMVVLNLYLSVIFAAKGFSGEQSAPRRRNLEQVQEPEDPPARVIHPSDSQQLDDSGSHATKSSQGKDSIDSGNHEIDKVEIKANQLKPFVHVRDYDSDGLSEQSRQTELSDIFISVKTAGPLHRERLDILLETWVQLAQEETYFFTDTDDEEYRRKTGGHIINTNCSGLHNRVALCCKMSVEFDYYIASQKRWFCHVDDDSYINVPMLSRLLQKYNHTEDWYLGRPSLSHPIEINDPQSPEQKFAFWFATGGAGFCLSRGLALKMMPYAAGGKLKTACANIRLPDDCTIGFVIYYHLRKELTSVREFHSHLEGLWKIRPQDIDKQITFSYNNKGTNDQLKNIIQVGGFPEAEDPSRFRSIHCRLFPYQNGCPGPVIR